MDSRLHRPFVNGRRTGRAHSDHCPHRTRDQRSSPAVPRCRDGQDTSVNRSGRRSFSMLSSRKLRKKNFSELLSVSIFVNMTTHDQIFNLGTPDTGISVRAFKRNFSFVVSCSIASKSSLAGSVYWSIRPSLHRGAAAITVGRESCEGNDRNVPPPVLLPFTNGRCLVWSPSISGICTSIRMQSNGPRSRASSTPIPFPASLTSWPRFSSSSMTICRLTGLSRSAGGRTKEWLDTGGQHAVKSDRLIPKRSTLPQNRVTRCHQVMRHRPTRPPSVPWPPGRRPSCSP